jgi:hypothetical protein
MKKYQVEWHNKKNGEAFEVRAIDGENHQDAFYKATEKWSFEDYPVISIPSSSGWGVLVGMNVHWFQNPNYAGPEDVDVTKALESPSQQSAPTDSSPRQPITSTGSPQSSSWATLYRVCGGIFFFVGLIGTIAVAQKDEEAGFQLAVMAIALTLTSFLFAFLIDVLTDMRHYLKRIAEKQ